MKILYIITQGEQGGGQKNVFDLAVGMHTRGHEVFVAIGEIENEGDKWLFSELEKNGISKQNLFELKEIQREIKIVRDIKSVFETIKLINKIKPDVVHLHSSKVGAVGALACFLTRTKSLYTVHGFVFLEPMNILKKIIYVNIEFFASLFRNFTILITEKDLEVGKKLFILRTPTPGGRGGYKLIYNGVSEKIKSEMLSQEEARKYLFEKINKKDEGQKIIGTISNLFKTKGLEYLIEAAALVCSKALPIGEGLGGAGPVFLVLGFGDESYKQELQNLINKHNLQNNFFLLGKTPNASKYLKAFDLFTLTSVKEGLPYTLLEAKMAGVPILATKVGGIPEMAKNFEINLVEPKNVEKISEGIKNILFNHPQPLLQKEGSSALPEIYSLDNMIEETLKVYQKMI